ncbi:NUDIX hydrolase [Nocardiopsis trehalosi]|uniref:NUDIX hydrolase n=1 Tax=Nocardiopsis trehalosi TaxID=109329 RepID=UPI00082C0010|nr:NUDIX domain-containing protein [Nocardiopsis trehalosi]
MVERIGTVVDVCVLLRNDAGRILLMERANTGFADGALGIPGGHLEVGESVVQGAVREAAEEVGVKLRTDDLACAHVAHHRNAQGATRIGFFFTASQWEGEPINAEPELCAGLHWVDPRALPLTVIPYIADIIRRVQSGDTFSVHGW